MKIIKGDRVVVLAGKDKGAEGVVQKAMPETGKVVVEGVNVAKKHQAPTRADQQGGIIDKAMPIDATRGGYQGRDDGAKIRVCTRTGEEIK